MFFCQVLGTDAVYRVIIDPPGEVVASVTGDNCNGETCYHSNTLTDTSTVTVDVVGCTITRLDSKNISTCKRAILRICVVTRPFLFVANTSYSFLFPQSVLQKTCWYLMSVGMRHQ